MNTLIVFNHQSYDDSDVACKLKPYGKSPL